MDSTKETFDAVLSNFKSRLTAKECEDFQFTTLDDVRSTVLRIQADQEQLQSVMNFTRIQSFLEAMEQFSNVIQVFLNASSMLCFVWGPMKFLFLTAHTWTESFETLLSAYDQIGKHIPLLEQYKAIFNHNPRMRQVLAYIYEDILEFHKRAIRFFSGHAWRQIFRAAWKDFDTRFKGILERLKHHKTLIREQADILHFQESQASSQEWRDYVQESKRKSQELLRQIEGYRREQADNVKRREEENRRQNLRSVIEWFSGAPSVLDQELFRDIRRRCPQSGEWILKQDKIANWLYSDVPSNPVLWINGIPGAGKTILTSVIVDDCLSRDTLSTGYFYCKEEDPKKNTAISVFRGILTQLLPGCPQVAQLCLDRSLNSGELILTSLKSAETFLEMLCNSLSKTYIIVDGLDECANSERKALLSVLVTIVENCEAIEPGKLRVLIVSQDFADIKNELKDSASSIFSLGFENSGDIEKFVGQETAELKRHFDLDEKQARQIHVLTCTRANGMFLFASLVMENLSKQINKKALIHEITEWFPHGLEQAYQRIMDRMKRNTLDSEWHIVQKLLGWMVCAKRTLRWHEIQCAISIDAIRQTVAFDENKLRVHIQELCGSLVRVLPGDRIELVHSTAKYYMTKTEYVDIVAVEYELAVLCLQYLVFPCFQKETLENNLQKYALDGHFVFQDYAVSMWFRHLGSYIKSGKALSAQTTDPDEDVASLETALDDFIMIYPDLGSEGTTLPKSYVDCDPFRDRNLYNCLILVWNHVLQHEEKGFKFRNDISLLSLRQAIERNRNLVEKLHPDHNMIRHHYGERPFKCSKITCFYFHEGFKEAGLRKKHINRHDRPFNCTILDCSSAEFGFTNGKDLEKHMRFYHPEESDLSEYFISPAKAPNEGLRFPCPQCPRHFTRKINLDAHVRNHSGHRPFACAECGKAFTRINDCKRHEKLHDKRR